MILGPALGGQELARFKFGQAGLRVVSRRNSHTKET